MTHAPATAPLTLQCKDCHMKFTRMDNLRRHERSAHGEPIHKCSQCEEAFHQKSNLLRHVRVSHAAGPSKRKCENEGPTPAKKRFRKSRKTALGVFASEFLKPSQENAEDLKMCFEELRPQIRHLLVEEIAEKRAIKWRIVMKAQLSRILGNGDRQTIIHYFGSVTQIELVDHTVPEHLEEVLSKVENSFEEFLKLGSGWTLDHIIHVEVQCAKYTPLAGRSYIPLTKKMQAKKAVLNIQNEDDKCLVWCLIAHKMNTSRKDHAERVSNYTPHESTIKMDGVEFPVPLTKIPSIEKMNDLRINVFGCEEAEIFPLYISKREDEDVVNLLLIANEETQHYCLIRDMSRLISSFSKHNGKCHICCRCLHRFSSERLLKEHHEFCKDLSPQRVNLPKEGENILKFENIHYQHPLPYAIYADFESIIVPLHSATPEDSTSYMENVARHEACGYAYVVVGPDGKAIKPVTVYRGPDAAVHFVENLLDERAEIAEQMMDVKPMSLSPQEEQDFKAASQCHICRGKLGADRVRDHDHLSGRYRGAAHNQCNLKFRLRKMIPVLFHNLKNYDAHHIVKTLGAFKDYEYEVIPTNMEKYISFSIAPRGEKRGEKVKLVFLDSYQFLPTSLEKLVSNMPPADFKLLQNSIPHDKIHLLLRKGVYPYEYMDSFLKFEETSLPPITAFFSTLSNCGISSEDYQHAQTVWKEFQLKSLGEYHDLYVKSDVLQLGDIFQNFRELCQRYYSIDCLNLFTVPALSWQACLKMTQQPLELFTDIDMHLFIERGIRGGISIITKRHASANNKYMENFDPTKPSSYIVYLDANNLYGWAMSQSLPYGDFRWEDVSHVSEEWLATISSDSDRGYILEVDLIYDESLHDMHNFYPLAAEKLQIQEDMLSPAAQEILNRLHGDRKFKGCEKLVPNLKDKKNYIVHYRNLQLYISLGLKLGKVHKVLSFRQKAWLKPYIEFNTEKRKNAKNSFEKDFFKLLNNSVYGKTMENMRNRADVQLVHEDRWAKKLVAAPSFKSFKIFTEELVGVERVKTSILLNRPLYVGYTILELSKVLMTDFHYNHIVQVYGEKAELLFSDTDSLMYNIYTEDFYQDMKMNQHLYDTSDYPPTHPLYSTKNKKKIGCFKDEMNGCIIEEFVGLRAKMYSIKSEGGNEKKTAKGVARQVVAQKMKHADYLRCLKEGRLTREKMMKIGSDCHQLYTQKLSKIALSPFDDKRYLLEDGIHSYAYGHYRIPNT
ncbi:uncharacterized protein LOC129229795 [Uloborus diversus]|uniref:uncharacterized protein LOC129229795 n=1 Tax=Uloborus diversus TaxID=327109 RepID=UPI00240A58F6|nr:uncharacterized protein LOC129229795 [Uloborus diversus]